MSAIDHSRTETAMADRLTMIRVLVGAFATIYLVVRLPHLLGFGGFDPARFAPVGILAGLSRPLPERLWHLTVLAAVPVGAAFTAGWRLRVTGPVFAALLLVVTTYRNSWGQVFHTENLMVLQVIVLAACLVVRRPDPRFVVKLLAVVTVVTYVLSGWAKLHGAGWDWIAGDTLRHQVAYDNLRKAALGAPFSTIGAQLVEVRWLFPPLAACTLAVELGAPIALLGRRFASLWVAAAWIFHLGILVLMAILFAYPLSGVAFAPFLPVERLMRGRRRAPDPAPAPSTVGAR